MWPTCKTCWPYAKHSPSAQSEDKADKMAVMKESTPMSRGWCWFKFQSLNSFINHVRTYLSVSLPFQMLSRLVFSSRWPSTKTFCFWVSFILFSPLELYCFVVIVVVLPPWLYCFLYLYFNLSNAAAWLMHTDGLTDCSVPLCSPLLHNTSQVSWIFSLPNSGWKGREMIKGESKRGEVRVDWQSRRDTLRKTEINFDF